MERTARDAGRADEGTRGEIEWGRLAGAVNGLLLVVLVALIGWQAADRRGGATVGRDRLETSTWTVERDQRAGLVVVFDTDVVSADAVGERVPEGLVHLEPEVPVEASWSTRRRLDVRPLHALPRARRVHVHLDPALLALTSTATRVVPPETAFVLTAPLRVLSVVATEHDDDGTARALVLSLDLPVDEKELRELLSVTALDDLGEEAARLAVDVTPLDAPGEHAWWIELPEGELPDDVVMRLAPGLIPRGGDVPLEAAFERDVTLRPRLLVTSVDAYDDGLGIELNHEVPLPAAGTLTVDPPVDFQVRRSWSELRLYGDFRPGATYRVTLHAGFPGTGPVRLRERVERSVRLRDLQPELAFPDRGTVLSSVARRQIAVRSVNVARMEVAARTVYANNVVRLVQARRSRSDRSFGPWTSTEIMVAGDRNEQGVERIDLDALLGRREPGTSRGLHEIRVRDLDGVARTVRKLVQITDLGVTARATRDALAVRVTSIAHASPVADATVTVLTPTNQVLVEGATAADGTAVLRYAARADDRVPFLVEVRAGEDVTFVDLDGFEVTLAAEAQSGRPYLTGGFECHVQPDRGAVRPGETARMTVTGRSARGVSPVGAEVDVRWHSPDGALRRTERLRFGDSGLLVAAHTTSNADPTGTWRVEVVDAKTETVVGSARFLVEAFVPDRLEASLEVPDRPRLGETARVKVAASWLEGAPAADRPFRASVRLDHAPEPPEGWEDWSFGSIAEDGPKAPPGALRPVRGVLRTDGTAEVALSLPDGARYDAQAFRATFRVDVEDPSGRPVRAALARDVRRPGPLLGARVEDGRLRVVLLDEDDRPAADATAQVTLEHRRWTWRTVRRTGADGRRRYVWQPDVVAEPAGSLDVAVTEGRGETVLPEQPDGPGWVVAVVRVEGEGGARRADAALDGAAPRPDRLRVEGPPNTVRPGETISLTVASPTAGTAFVTLETTTVHAVATAPVRRGRDTLTIRVPDDMEAPNVHAVVTVVAPQARADATPPYWIAGATSLRLDHREREVEVALLAPGLALPASDVEIVVEAPGATEATVALVDEGILRLTAHADPDPLAHFHARRRLATRGADSGTRLMERPGYAPDVLDGGGENGVGALAARLDASTTAVIETVALFRGPVALDPDGRARVTFRLPQYEGRLRAMVIAAGPERVGAASAPVTVRAPLGLRVATPRRLAPGDRTVATLTLRNGTGEDAAVRLDVTASDGLALAGDVPAEVRLADGESASLDVELAAATASDAASLTVVATATGERRRVQAFVPVVPAGLFETERAGLRLAARDELRIPGTWRQGTRRARLVVAPGVGGDLLPSLAALLRYPHGCVEQTSSRAHAVLAARPLLDDLAPDAAERASDMVVQAVARLRSMQTPRGGLAFWPGGRTETDLGSLVGLDVLLEARDQGFDVDAEALRKLARWNERRLAQRREVAYRAMSVEILSHADVAVGPWLNDLAAAVETTEDRARVALALARVGDVDRARELLAEAATSGGDDVDIDAPGDLLFSPTRARALLLRALLLAAPGDTRVGPLADGLRARAARPDALTTQAQAHAVRALAALHVRDLRRGEPVRGTVTVDGAAHAVDGRTEIVVPPDGPGVVTVDLDREVAAYLEVSGVRVDPGTGSGASGLRVSRVVIDVETGREVRTLRRGGLYEVVLDVHVSDPTSNVLVTDLLPAGLEAQSPRLGAADRSTGERPVDHVDVRDDRVMLHLDGPVEGAFHVRYRAHATFPGRYDAPPPAIEALYLPGSLVRGEGADGVEVER